MCTAYRGPERFIEHYLVHMDEHHKSIPFTGRILLLFKKCVHQFWGIRNEEIKVSGETEIFLDYLLIALKTQNRKTNIIQYKLDEVYMYTIQGDRKPGVWIYLQYTGKPNIVSQSL